MKFDRVVDPNTNTRPKWNLSLAVWWLRDFLNLKIYISFSLEKLHWNYLISISRQTAEIQNREILSLVKQKARLVVVGHWWATVECLHIFQWSGCNQGSNRWNLNPLILKYKKIQKIQIPNKNTTEKYKSLIRLQSGVEPLKFEPTKTLTALFSGPPKNLYLAIQIARQTQRKIPMTNNIILVEIACYQPYISWLTFSSPADILK